MRKVYWFLLIIILTGLSSLYAFEAGQVEFNIRFFDRRVYYVETDPIFVQVTITNNSPVPYRFKLADDRAFSIDFDIRTMTNRLLPRAELLTEKRTSTNNVFFREIAIESGESFSFVEDLREYVKFEQPGSFRVRALVYPELLRSNVIPAIESNFLSLNLRPASIHGPDGIPLEMDVATGAVLVRQRIPPDEVVTYMLTGRQQSQWERFFLYLDIESMVQRDPAQRRRYIAENEAGRRRMVTEYRQNLQNAVVDGDIHQIPTSFEILRTVYNNDEGSVVVLQRYRHAAFTELRHYTYFLEKKDNFWTIVNYTVQGMGTTANN
ncbi:MAG: hypothetical protein FWD24_02150 [Treponema sp.]|nr:hypothetical protein [Treponema sp.]